MVGERGFEPPAPNRFPENVVVQAVVIPELELGHIQRQVLGGDFVIGADNAALEDRHGPVNLVSGDALFSGEHRMDHPERRRL